MKTGHPYETEELDRMRAEQRRVLWTAPGWFFEQDRLRLPERDLSGRTDSAFLEFSVRSRAADLIEKVSEVLSEWRASAERARFGEFLNTLDDSRFTRPVQSVQEALTKHVFGDGQRDPGPVPESHGDDINALLFYLQLADQLASDGYRDARLV